jgi:glycosyltransferase involved in cell wall biosynthesis
MDTQGKQIAVVVPAYRVEGQIEGLLRAIPAWVSVIIVVDDCSPDRSGEVARKVATGDARVVVPRHEKNQGVGGAMKTGYAEALRRGADVVVKLDGDGQMDPAQLARLVRPILAGQADYAKGNRFRDFQALRRMPLARRVGNGALSFLTKWATGYWNIFDPNNGYVAIHRTALEYLPLESVASSYFFESSMLLHLNIIEAVVVDVPMPAFYGEEKSSLRIRRVLVEFPCRLVAGFLKRLVLRKMLYDFSLDALYWITGVPLLLFGVIFGGIKWFHYWSLNVPAPTGTIMVAALPVILGFQLVLNALVLDIMNVPKAPISGTGDSEMDALEVKGD